MFFFSIQGKNEVGKYFGMVYDGQWKVYNESWPKHFTLDFFFIFGFDIWPSNSHEVLSFASLDTKYQFLIPGKVEPSMLE